MSASQAGYFNLQAFTDAGALMVNGRLYTLVYGTTTHKNAFTNHEGTVAHTYTSDGIGGQYIALNARGELPAPLFLTAGSYDIALKNPDGSTEWTRRADPVFDLSNDLSAANGSSLITYTAQGIGPVSRSVQNKLRETASIEDFGAIATQDGGGDSTAAIQAALDSGLKAIYIPPKTYNFSSLLMPTTFQFVLYGDGPASRLVQTGTGIRYSTASVYYGQHTIRDFTIRGGSGTGDSLNGAGAGGLTISDMYFEDVPVGFSSIVLDGAAATYNHDQRATNIQIYYNNTNGGLAGIRCGPLSADQTIDNFLMNGGFQVDYCILCDSGAQSLYIQNSHPYNAKINILRANGNNSIFVLANTSFDNALQDLVYLNDMDSCIFTGCFFQATNAGKDSVKLVSTCVAVSFFNCMWNGQFGSLATVRADAASNTIIIYGGGGSALNNFTDKFVLPGLYSYARGVAGYLPFGVDYQLHFNTATTQAQATTQFLGANGLNATEGPAQFTVAQDSILPQIFIATTATPAAGQTFTFQLRVNAANVGAPLVVNNGSFGGTIVLGNSIGINDAICVQSTFSATSGAAGVRGYIKVLS